MLNLNVHLDDAGHDDGDAGDDDIANDNGNDDDESHYARNAGNDEDNNDSRMSTRTRKIWVAMTE